MIDLVREKERERERATDRDRERTAKSLQVVENKHHVYYTHREREGERGTHIESNKTKMRLV